MEQGMQDLNYAIKEKQTDEQSIVPEAIRDQAKVHTIFSVPGGIIYRLPEAKTKNAQKKEYIGKAKIIATNVNMESLESSALQWQKLRRYLISN
jgi:hypothetical protein